VNVNRIKQIKIKEPNQNKKLMEKMKLIEKIKIFVF